MSTKTYRLPSSVVLICGLLDGCGAMRDARFLSFDFFFGPRFEIRGPHKRVDLIFQKSGRPDSRAEKKVPIGLLAY